MEKQSDPQNGVESRAQVVQQINTCLRSGDYSRALDIFRGAEAAFPDDSELSELEKLAHDGVQRNADANRLITASQELFAQGKSPEALQLLRQAYELDKRNSLARAILANALVEHAQSLVETDWLEAEILTNQALHLNPAHPTAKTIHSQIVEQKKTSSVEDWVVRARKLQSCGDLFKALAWVAEGLAVHPDDPGLLQIHDSIQRDQGARRRQARRGDVEELRRMESSIDEAADTDARQALAERIQAMAAKYWTDGEILSIANRLLHRLGFDPGESPSPSLHGKSATVIFHVPRPSAPEASSNGGEIPANHASPGPVPLNPAPAASVPQIPAAPAPPPSQAVPAAIVPSSEVSVGIAPSVLGLSPSARPESHARQSVSNPAPEPFKSPAATTSSPSRSQPPTSSNSKFLILVSVTAIVLIAATFFFTRRHYAPPQETIQSSVAGAPARAVTAPVTQKPITAEAASPVQGAGIEPPTEPPSPALPTTTGVDGKAPLKDAPLDVQSSHGRSRTEQRNNDDLSNVQQPTGPPRKLGALLIVAGQDDVRVFLDGTLQPQLTHGGQLLLTNLEFRDYVVRVSKSGFQDPPQQMVRIRKGEQPSLVFQIQRQNPQPQPRLASLVIQGATPGTAVLVDQAAAGTIQSDGTLSVSSLSPGDHTLELRKERFQARQLKKHFGAGETVVLSPADAVLEPASGALTIAFAPADATVVLVKGDVLKIVRSGVPLDLAPGAYTLTARTAEKFTRTATVEVIAGQSRTLALSLAANGMSKWDNPGDWKNDRNSFTRKGGDFVEYGALPVSGTFVFSATLTRGHLLQWVLDYADPRNYVLCQMDEENFYRSVIRNGQKTNQIKVPHKGAKKSSRTIQIRVSPAELVQQIQEGDHFTVLDRWAQSGSNFTLGKFGFYIPGDDEIAVSNFSYYADLNIR